MIKSYFTFGYGQPHGPNTYTVIEIGTSNENRNEMFRRFGPLWAFQYDNEKQQREIIEEYQMLEIKWNGEPWEETTRMLIQRINNIGTYKELLGYHRSLPQSHIYFCEETGKRFRERMVEMRGELSEEDALKIESEVTWK